MQQRNDKGAQQDKNDNQALHTSASIILYNAKNYLTGLSSFLTMTFVGLLPSESLIIDDVLNLLSPVF
jgi:hypothetical protein